MLNIIISYQLHFLPTSQRHKHKTQQFIEISYYSYELKIVGTMPQYLLKCKFIAQIHKSICTLHLQLFLSYGVWANKLNWIVIHDSKRAIYLSGSDNIHLTLTIFKKWSIFKLLNSCMIYSRGNRCWRHEILTLWAHFAMNVAQIWYFLVSCDAITFC